MVKEQAAASSQVRVHLTSIQLSGCGPPFDIQGKVEQHGCMKVKSCCPNCHLVQYQTAANDACQRCGLPLPPPQPEAQPPPAPTPYHSPLPPPDQGDVPVAQSPEPYAQQSAASAVHTGSARRVPVMPAYQQSKRIPWLPLAVVLGIISVMLGIAITILPGWLQLRGTPVGHFKDSTGLIEIDFPDDWYHLGMHRGGSSFPQPQSESYLSTIRGSFYLQHGKEPSAAVCFRIVSLGLTAGLGKRTTNEERARSIAANYGEQVKRLGGTFNHFVTKTRRYGPQLVQPIKIGEFSGVRMLGEVVINRPFYCWDEGGSFQVKILWFTRGNRLNLIYIVAPSELGDEMYEIDSMVDSAEWAAAPL
jgi:hypothetical protein